MKPVYMMLLIGGLTLGGCQVEGASLHDDDGLAAIRTDAGRAYDGAPGAGVAGDYLSSIFAQNRYDWRAAGHHLERVLKHDPKNMELRKRAMVLAMGYGDMEGASRHAGIILEQEQENDFAELIMIVRAMAREDFTAAAEKTNKMASGDMTDFVRPILAGWVHAALGRDDDDMFGDTTLHLSHAALIAIYRQDHDRAAHYIDQMMDGATLSMRDAERVADMLAYTGLDEEALVLYQGLLLQSPQSRAMETKINSLQDDPAGFRQDLAAELLVENPNQGAALAMYDMAFILFQERSDSSAKLFVHMALALDPSMTRARLLLADALTRNDRFDEAIAYLSDVPDDHPSYLSAQRHIAELMFESGRHDEARAKLEDLFRRYNDIESLIRIGDLFRYQENYRHALEAYNRAAGKIGADIPEQYWHLLYARGMAYEREGQWRKAETDLKAALVYRPDHPYLLNYLGYGWADHGENLEQSLELIKRAVSLRPNDGHIIDSLGWVQYRLGRYEDALPNLEKAASLIPYDPIINDHLGDVYWKVGRRTEARFQWQRAYNHADDEDLRDLIAQKLRHGLRDDPDTRRAQARAE